MIGQRQAPFRLFSLGRSAVLGQSHVADWLLGGY